jgi:hypothetical protein
MMANSFDSSRGDCPQVADFESQLDFEDIQLTEILTHSQNG